MFYVVLAVHCTLCLMMVFLVLLQQGKGADMGAAFGSGSSNSLFGAGGPGSFITRLTTGVCIGFMITSILLVRAYSNVSFTPTIGAGDPLKGSLMDKAVEQQAAAPAAAPVEEAPAPAAPQAAAAAPAEEKK